MVFGSGINFLLVTFIIRVVFRKLRFITDLSCTKVTSCLTLCLLICFETVLLSEVSDCTKAFYIHWNTTNAIFRTNNSDHVITVNDGNIGSEYDQVNIICPVYTPGTYEGTAEQYIIYNVSKEEYESCRITNPSPRIIAICDKPYKLMFYTITFRPFTPQPGGLEFPPGQDYYFISTSSNEDLHRRIGGRCSSNNMKVIFKVCCRPDDHSKTVNVGKNRSLSDFTSSTTPEGIYTRDTRYKISLINNFPMTTSVPHTTKKYQEFPENPNEVLKNEELSHNIPDCALIFKSSGVAVVITILVVILNNF